jgi:minor extracellular serine protease Vpr
MKQILLSSFLTLTVFTAFGQKKLGTNPNPPQKLEIINDAKDVRGVSPSTAFLMLDLRKADATKLSEEQLIEKYALIKKDGKVYANSFITIKNDFDANELNKQGVLIGINKGNIITALIPINQLELLTENPNINYIQIGEKVAPTMDNARTATNVNQVHVGTSLPQPYFGEGVVVGIIDIGFDYTHPNFYNSTGTSGYRVKRVWEQNATSGTPPTGYTYGRELTTQTAILAAQRDATNQSHGTHVAGIAAGAGGGASTTYTGVASKADLVFVSTNMSDPGVLEGIEYIQNYAASVGKPCVINMSLGKHIGPHDGTSIFDKLCDSFFVGEGRILVGSAGNEGGDNLYLGKTYTGTDTTLYTFLNFPNSTLGTNGMTPIDVWGNVGDNFYVGVHIYNTSTDAFEDATPYLYNGAFTGTYSHTLYDDDFWSPDACYVNISTGIDPNNNKPRVYIELNHTAQDDNYRYVLIEIRAASTQTKMWANNAIFTNNLYSSPVLSGSSNSTVGELGGTGKNMISVGAYTSKNSWTSFSSGTQTAPAYSAVGAIAPFSSKGPTADGRTKPDITAPGNIIGSSVSRFDASYTSSSPRTVSGVMVGSTTWWYGMMEGTSMAAPMTTGIIALWLEMYPDLTPTQAKEIMQSTAITDGHTGTIPMAGSNTWGWGKINAWVDIPSSVPPQPTISPSTANICAGTSINLTAPSGYSAYKWSNGATTPTITVSTAGTYKVKVTNSSGFNSPWSDGRVVTVNPNPPVPTITKNADTLISSAITGNQWYKNGTIISGATGQKYTLTSSGNYKVVVTSTHGCSSESAVMNTSPTSISNIENQTGISIYPNPASQQLNIKFDNSFKNLSYTIYDNSGKIVLSDKLNNINKGDIKTINLGNLPNGIYNVKLYNNETNHTVKITVVQ